MIMNINNNNNLLILTCGAMGTVYSFPKVERYGGLGNI